MANKSNKLEKEVIRELFDNIQGLINSSRTKAALTVNREITLLYWQVGKEINGRILKNERAEYGERIVSSLSERLTSSFGKGWGKRHLWHCVRSADIFSENEIVNPLSTQLSWTHLRELAAIEDELKRTFYTELSIRERWSTRTLQERFGSLLYERTALSRKPEELIKRELNVLKTEGPVTPIGI